MTVADWGRVGGASRAEPHRGHARAPAQGYPFAHPAHGGPTPDQDGWFPAGPSRHGGAQASPFDAGDRADRPRLGRMLNLFGGVLSVALVLGLAVWGYKLAVRDVSGVPVVRALAGPMRIQPEDPGGVVTPHQGLAVNDVPAVSTSSAPVEEVMLAPTPVGLAPEDKPAQPNLPAVSAGVAAVPAMAEEPDPVISLDAAADAAVAEALASIGFEEPLTGALAEAGAVGADAIPATVPGVARSPRPAHRPTSLAPVAVAQTAGGLDAPEPVAALDLADADGAVDMASVAASIEDSPAEPRDVVTGDEVAATEVEAGVRLAQLGAFETIELAREQWQHTANRFPDLFAGRTWTIEPAQSGGRTFYRLRAMGFADLDEARDFCSTLMAANSSCIPAVAQ